MRASRRNVCSQVFSDEIRTKYANTYTNIWGINFSPIYAYVGFIGNLSRSQNYNAQITCFEICKWLHMHAHHVDKMNHIINVHWDWMCVDHYPWTRNLRRVMFSSPSTKATVCNILQEIMDWNRQLFIYTYMYVGNDQFTQPVYIIVSLSSELHKIKWIFSA